MVRDISDTSVQLSWSRGFDNHSPIAKYTLQARTLPSGPTKPSPQLYLLPTLGHGEKWPPPGRSPTHPTQTQFQLSSGHLRGPKVLVSLPLSLDP